MKLLRLEADNTTQLTIPGSTGYLTVLPPIVDINTTGIDAAEQLQDGYFKAPRPGLYRFNSCACAAAGVLGTIVRNMTTNKELFPFTNGNTSEAEMRNCSQVNGVLKLTAGDLVGRILFTPAGTDVAVALQSDANYLEIEYLGEA